MTARTTAQRIADYLVAWRWPCLALAILATALAWPWARELSFDRSIEAMFAADDPLLVPYRQLKRTFGGDEIALAAYVDPELLSPAGLDRLEQLTNKLGGVKGVATAFSLTTRSPILNMRVIESPVKERFLKFCEGYTIGDDRQTAGVVCLLEPESRSPVARSVTIDDLRKTVEAHDRTGVLTGEPVLVVDGFRHLEQDGRLLGTTSTLLLMLTIVISFRSLRWVIVPVAIVYATLLWTQGALVASGYRLSMVSSMLWALVTVICVGTVIHLVVGFREARESGATPYDALRLAGGALLLPIFWSCMTDAAGFGSLLVAKVGPVHDFGAMMALASVICLAAMALVLPGLVLFGRFDADPKRAWGERGLDVGLDRLSSWIEHRPRLLGVAMLVMVGTSVAGIAWLEVETDFTKNFRASSPLVKSYEFVESRLGGAGVLDVLVPVPTDSTMNFFERVRQLENRLRSEVKVRDEQGREQPGLTKVVSVVDALDVLLPGTQVDPTRLDMALAPMKKWMPLAGALHGHDPQQGGREFLRVMLRARERQPAMEKQRLIDQVADISREVFPEAQVTGFFVLLTRLIESVSRDQWLTFGVATAGIALMVFAAFRSLTLALVALVPNALPILMVTGIMGWLGVRINMGAAMIASVSMGLAVDSSIHYITDFRRRRAEGMTVHEALHAGHQKVGRAMIFSTLALVVGFSAMALSEFVPTIYFGVLVSLAMLGGLLGNLVILPLLLALVTRD